MYVLLALCLVASAIAVVWTRQAQRDRDEDKRWHIEEGQWWLSLREPR